MQKSSIEKMLKAEGHYAGDLVSLDFKSESLQSFLENVVQLVNQHSQRINALEMDKMTIDEVRKGHIDIVNSSKLSPSLIKQITAVNLPAKVETYGQAVQGISTNLTNHSNALQFLHDTIKRLNQKIENFSQQLDGFETKQNSRQVIRKLGISTKKVSEDECEKVLGRLKELQMKTTKKIAQFENTTKQVEKKTLWKITECQSGLLKRITAEYVEKALSQLESKIHNDIANTKNQQLNELKFNSDSLKAKLDVLSKNVDEYEKENKGLIKQLEEAAKSFQKKQKIDHDKRETEMKIKQLLLKIDRLQKREDPQDLELRFTKITAEQGEKLNNVQTKVKKIEKDLQSVNNVMSSMGGSDGSGLDPHKLCHMDGQVRRLRDANRTNQLKLQTLDDELRTKLLIFEQRIMTTLGMLKNQDNFVSREEMYQSLSRLREPVMEKLGENQTLIYEVNGKLAKLEMFEKATKRKIKQMTRGDDLNKILDMKMNIGQAEAQFNSYGMKLENLEMILNKVRMEIEANSSFLRMLQDEMNEPEEGINIIGPKQKVFPAKCLGCGQKHVPSIHDNNMMQGTDGKYYKVDLKNSHLYDQREVYGVTPSQIAVYDSGVKKHMTTTRPTSVRTNIRPSSAKHF